MVARGLRAVLNLTFLIVSRINAGFMSLQTVMERLHDRWQDEKDYEDKPRNKGDIAI